MLKVDTDGEFIFFKEKFIMDTYLAEHAYLGISVKSVINDVVIDDAAFLQGEDIQDYGESCIIHCYMKISFLQM